MLDTGVLVAMYARDDPRHAGVARWMATFQGDLHTVESVLTEAAYFLPVRTRAALADLAMSGNLHLHHPDGPGYARIATLDVADFSVYRIHGRKRFELELLR